MQALGLILNMGTSEATLPKAGISNPNGNMVSLQCKPMSVHSVIPLDRTITDKLSDSQLDPEIQSLESKFPKLFSKGIGLYNGPEHQIRLKPDAIPHRSRVREAPLLS